jgi:predicted oxidoreductase
VIVASGGIGGNHDLVRQNWPKRLGAPPKNMISGVPEHVDGRMIGITEAAGARLINRDRMWHYVEGIRELVADLAAPRHPHPARPVVDVVRRHRQAPALAAVSRLRHAGHARYIMRTGYDYSWFVLTRASSRRNSRCRARSRIPTSPARAGDDAQARATNKGAPAPVEAFKQHGRFHRARQPGRSRRGMNALAGNDLLKLDTSCRRSRRATARSPIPSSRTRR